MVAKGVEFAVSLLRNVATRAAQNAEEHGMTDEKPSPDREEAEVQDLPLEDETSAEVTGGSGPSGPGPGTGWDRVRNPEG